jgi:type II restriction enzyme
MIEALIGWIKEAAAKKDYSFVAASEEIGKRISGLSKDQIIGLVEEIHVIPESIEHDSSEEKIYTKASDAVVACAIHHLGLTTQVLAERADSADVVGQSKHHNYSFVADSKVFRLSRTAKNQKDFKIDSMNSWRGDCDYAVVVAPYYQYPSRRSAIYQKSVAHNVGLLGFEHLGFMLRSGIVESGKKSVENLFSYPLELQIAITVAQSSEAKYSSIKLRKVVLDITGSDEASFTKYNEHFHAKLAERASQEIAFCEAEIEKIRKLSHQEAIEALISARKIRSKIEIIRAFLREDGAE